MPTPVFKNNLVKYVPPSTYEQSALPLASLAPFPPACDGPRAWIVSLAAGICEENDSISLKMGAKNNNAVFHATRP